MPKYAVRWPSRSAATACACTPSSARYTVSGTSARTTEEAGPDRYDTEEEAEAAAEAAAEAIFEENCALDVWDRDEARTEAIRVKDRGD